MRDDRRVADLGDLQLDEAGWLSIALGDDPQRPPDREFLDAPNMRRRGPAGQALQNPQPLIRRLAPRRDAWSGFDGLVEPPLGGRTLLTAWSWGYRDGQGRRRGQ